MAKKEQQQEPGNTNAWKIVILPAPWVAIFKSMSMTCPIMVT